MAISHWRYSLFQNEMAAIRLMVFSENQPKVIESGNAGRGEKLWPGVRDAFHNWVIETAYYRTALYAQKIELKH